MGENFEWDPNKSAWNERERNITFLIASEVFDDLRAVITEDNRVDYGEVRNIITGVTYAGELLTIVFTIRGSNFRIISARKANRRERRDYRANKA